MNCSRTLQRNSCWLLILLCSACVHAPPKNAELQVSETVIGVPSRGIRIPATITLPGPAARDMPLVVMAHGHGGSRSEAGGFDQLAHRLALGGIASIRMDFPGCGDSDEAFTKNNLGNMLRDVIAARDFTINNYSIDADRVAIHGYSMGARIALQSSENHDWAAIGNWAPVASAGEASMFTFLGGQDVWRALRTQAEADGHATFVTPWGQTQLLGRRWFADLAASRPLRAAAAYDGPVLAICGRQDTIAPVSACMDIHSTLQRAAVEQHDVDGGHGFGFYSGDPSTADEVLQLTVAFFVRHLR